MIKIRKDKIEINVTKGAFENLYKDQGFEIVRDTGKKVIKEAVFAEPVVEKDDDIVPPMKEDREDFDAFILNELKADKDEKVEKVVKPKPKKGLK
jgi:hypothetical protein